VSSGFEEYIQLDFFGLLPGAAGGRALRDKRGREYFQQLAAKSAARPAQARRLAALKATATRRYRRHHIARTRVFVEIDEQVTERVIPYWPRNTRRRRPIYVRIELARTLIPDAIPLLERLKAELGLIEESRATYRVSDRVYEKPLRRLVTRGWPVLSKERRLKSA
jgi:hypothetical protein